MPGTKTLVIMGLVHTKGQVEREDRFGGWVSLWRPTRQTRRVNPLSIWGPFPSRPWDMVVDERPSKMPRETRYRAAPPKSADPLFFAQKRRFDVDRLQCPSPQVAQPTLLRGYKRLASGNEISPVCGG